jgi:hypothetical protein
MEGSIKSEAAQRNRLFCNGRILLVSFTSSKIFRKFGTAIGHNLNSRLRISFEIRGRERSFFKQIYFEKRTSLFRQIYISYNAAMKNSKVEFVNEPLPTYG